MAPRRQGRRGWRYLTNHGTVALVIASDPQVRMTDIAARTGLSRRAVQMIITDLVDAGYVDRTRVGRRNRYQVDAARPLRHPSLRGHARVEDLLSLLSGNGR